MLKRGGIFLFLVMVLGGPQMLAALPGPERVVSMNLCTDQLLLMVADPNQILSLSYLAHRPSSAVLFEEARNFPKNHGLSEEIFNLNPDLVLAGVYSTRYTTSLLKRLGKRVEVFQPARTLDDIRKNVLQMGRLLMREKRAEKIIAEFDRNLKKLAAFTPAEANKQTLGLFGPNGRTTGAGTLADALVRAAGYKNLARRLDIRGSGHLPLEILIQEQPDILALYGIRGIPTRSREILSHPALTKSFSDTTKLSVESKYWICGAPFITETIVRLLDARRLDLLEASQ